MTEYRAIVCGGRDYNDVSFIWSVLDEIDQMDGSGAIRLVIDGASDMNRTLSYMGANYWAHQWALARGRDTIRVPARWDIHGRAAGPIRNADMLANHNANLVIAFPGGRGTDDMIKRAERASIKVIRAAEEQP